MDDAHWAEFDTAPVPAKAERDGGLQAAHGPDDEAGEIGKVRAVLGVAQALTGWDGEPGPHERLGPREAAAALESAQEAILRELCVLSIDSRGRRAQLAAVLTRIGLARSAVQEAASLRRGSSVTAVRQALDHLRTANTVADLIRRVPAEIGRIGYDRCMISRLVDGCWVAKSTFVRDNPEQAEAMTQVGSRVPRRVDRNLIESEVVRQRTAILVADARNNPRVHRELQQVAGTTSYVAAPLVVGNSVIGFLHADGGSGDKSVDAYDRDLLAMFGECLGFAFERAVFHERLLKIRVQVAQYSTSVTDLVDELIDSDRRLDTSPAAGPAPRPALAGGGAALPAGSPGLGMLTPREQEVLTYLANGETNANIAARLVVAESTVKAHVKHILRKLGALNRAEAISWYLRGLSAGPAPPPWRVGG